MIPKIIHYCWFGGNPLPPLAEKCIASWRKFLPDYEIWQWRENCVQKQITKTEDEDCLFDKVLTFDVNMIPYTAEAYRLGKYAFVSDYARFWILYKYGGLYFDTDVELIRPIDDIIERGDFMGCESDAKGGRELNVNPGLGLGTVSGNRLIGCLLDEYSDRKFVVQSDGGIQETIVDITTNLLKKHGLKDVGGIQDLDGLLIYPSEYFCPIHIVTKRLHITSNTRTIHHYMASWKPTRRSIKDRLRAYIPECCLLAYNRVKHMQK